VYVKEISASKKLPHIPDTEKVEKVHKTGVSAVGSATPKMHDTVLVDLKLTTLDNREIFAT